MNEISKKQKKAFKGVKKQLYRKPNKRQNIEDEINNLRQKCDDINSSAVTKFKDFPLSQNTLKGIQLGKFDVPTDIQKESIGLALQGHDVLGAAKTGSGKTLAFLIPVLECLYKSKWTPLDGLGALIISPTRELAYQTFQVLRKIGKMHDFSAGLVIGGKHVREEAERITQTNIIVCTPGRLLQHMDQTPGFNADQLQILVLDEADRILDLGFRDTVNAIIENLPLKRQTLLFSATQTKSVKDLGRLSLKNPMYVSVHEHAKHSTPTHLEQNYIVAELEDKLNIIWSFVKAHLKNKLIVFLQSCKQVRFVYECIRRLRPGFTVLALHGVMNQVKRMEVYQEFCRKNHVCLFATDIAARGLDFPAIDWVVQYDCPEDATTYIHRVGRTARYNKDGQALLILLPSEEEGMVKKLEEKKIPINKIRINPKETWDIQPKLQSLCAADVALKEFGKRAFMSYIRSVYLMKNKNVFNVENLDFDKFAKSLGLIITPRVRFLQKALSKKEKNKNETTEKPESQRQHEADRKLPHNLRDLSSVMADNDDESDSDDDILKVKSTTTGKEVLTSSDESEEELPQQKESENKKHQAKKPLTKAAQAKKVLKKRIAANTKTLFDEEGEEIIPVNRKARTDMPEVETEGGINLEKAREYLQKEDLFDKETYRQKIKARHREKRLKEKEKRRQENKIKTKAEEEESDVELAEGVEETNLDLLPDPDKVYGTANSSKGSTQDSEDSEQSATSEEDSEQSDQEDSDDEEQGTSSDEAEYSVPKKKRKLPEPDYLADDEALALSLLRT